MLRVSILQWKSSWNSYLPLIEFAYNNSYHSSNDMASFKAMYGKTCQTPLCWTKVDEWVLVGLEIVDTTNTNIQLIKRNLKAAQDRQKSIADRHSRDYEYDIDDFVFLKLSPWKCVVRFDPCHVIQPEPLEMNQDASYVEEPVAIIDRQDKTLRNKVIPLVKVLWRNHAVEETTWETEELMRS
ncbi:uncharacterized protein [Pyrus communis]|uniref:uncharacterized protein n=1 Tax=Pyrus communis TaxID=23211 RepID=UPI0035BF28CA